MVMVAEKRTKSVRGRSKDAMVQKANPANQSAHCHNCTLEKTSRRRSFSEQAWTVLLLWNEITPNTVDQAICDDCYDELRDVLIDRSEEVEAAMNQEGVDKIRQSLNRFAS